MLQLVKPRGGREGHRTPHRVRMIKLLGLSLWGKSLSASSPSAYRYRNIRRFKVGRASNVGHHAVVRHLRPVPLASESWPLLADARLIVDRESLPTWPRTMYGHGLQQIGTYFSCLSVALTCSNVKSRLWSTPYICLICALNSFMSIWRFCSSKYKCSCVFLPFGSPRRIMFGMNTLIKRNPQTSLVLGRNTITDERGLNSKIVFGGISTDIKLQIGDIKVKRKIKEILGLQSLDIN